MTDLPVPGAAIDLNWILNPNVIGISSGGLYSLPNPTPTTNTPTTSTPPGIITNAAKNQPGITFKYGTNTWYMVLQPAMDPILPMQGSRGAPGAAAGGIVVKAKPLIARHVIPGFGPIIQHLGVYSTVVSFVGAFVGYEGTNQNNISEFYTYSSSNWQANPSSNSTTVVDSYGAFTTFWSGVVKSGYQLQVSIATNTVLSGSSFKQNSLRDTSGQPSFTGHISKIEAMYVRDDLTWYNIDIEVVDQPNAIPVQLPACKNSDTNSSSTSNSNSTTKCDPTLDPKTAITTCNNNCKIALIAPLSTNLNVDNTIYDSNYNVYLVLDTSNLKAASSGNVNVKPTGTITNTIWLRSNIDGKIYQGNDIDIAYAQNILNLSNNDAKTLIQYRDNENRIIFKGVDSNYPAQVTLDITNLKPVSSLSSIQNGNLASLNTYYYCNNNNNNIYINVDGNFYNFNKISNPTFITNSFSSSQDSSLLGIPSCQVQSGNSSTSKSGVASNPASIAVGSNQVAQSLTNPCPTNILNDCTPVLVNSNIYYIGGICNQPGNIYNKNGNQINANVLESNYFNISNPSNPTFANSINALSILPLFSSSCESALVCAVPVLINPNSDSTSLSNNIPVSAILKLSALYWYNSQDGYYYPYTNNNGTVTVNTTTKYNLLTNKGNHSNGLYPVS
jgi:hypothetical protein